MKQRYKFLLRDGRSIVSKHGRMKWKIGEWQHLEGPIETCGNGLHCSDKIREAFSYVQGDILAVVEAKGASAKEDDKSAWSDMRIVKAYKWTKKDSVALSIYAAELCLKNFEKLYPDDKRPREAIEAARKVLEHDTAANRSAARSAAESAARSAARSAAWAAAESAAWAAAESAESAARSAAWAAAESAARSAAWAALKRKIERWMKQRMENELQEVKR